MPIQDDGTQVTAFSSTLMVNVTEDMYNDAREWYEKRVWSSGNLGDDCSIRNTICDDQGL